MAKTMSVTVYVGSKIAEVRAQEGNEPVVRCPEPFDANEFAVLACFTETVRAWSAGKNIDRYFNPTIKVSSDDMVLRLCMWARSGKLVVKDTSPENKWQHADTIEDAMGRKRSFTCYQSLLPLLPTRREKGQDGS